MEIGAAVGIAVSAVASTVAAVLGVLRYRADHRHVVVRLKVWRPLEDPRDVNVTASLFNQGRPVFVEDMYIYFSKDDWMSLHSDKQEFPTEVATGRSLRVPFRLAQLEANYEGMILAFDDTVNYKGGDLPRMRLKVEDGEGHEHWASLSGESLRNVRAVVNARRDHPYEEVTLQHTDGSNG